jgi:hypothetical protein
MIYENWKNYGQKTQCIVEIKMSNFLAKITIKSH